MQHILTVGVVVEAPARRAVYHAGCADPATMHCLAKHELLVVSAVQLLLAASSLSELGKFSTCMPTAAVGESVWQECVDHTRKVLLSHG